MLFTIICAVVVFCIIQLFTSGYSTTIRLLFRPANNLSVTEKSVDEFTDPDLYGSDSDSA